MRKENKMEAIQPMSNAFAKTLQEIRSGYALSEASEKLAEVVNAVRATGRNGALTLRLNIKPASRGETVTLMVEDEIVVKLPKLDRPQTVFFAGENNLLQRNDPRQKEMEFRAVPSGAVQAETLKKVVNE
jgi:hypothetical protein